MKSIRYETSGSTLTLCESSNARKIAALKRFGVASVGATVVLTALLIPDFFGRYKDADPTDGVLFIAATASISALLGFSLGLSRMLRAQRWVFDPDHRELRLEQTVMGKASGGEAVELSDVAEIFISAGALYMKLGEQRDQVKLIEAKRDELDAFLDQFGLWIKKHRLNIQIARDLD